MDRQYIDEHHVIARYLADRLTAAEREAFEAYYLEHPDVVKEMETVARFKAGLIDLERSGELDALISGRPRLFRRGLFAAAAAVAGLAVCVTLFLQRGSDTPIVAASPSLLVGADRSPMTIGSTVQVFRTRSSGADAQIPLPTTPRAIALQVLPEFSGASFHAALLTNERELGRAAGLTPNADGLVPLYVDSARLSPGLYRLVLVNEATSESSEFRLQFQ